MSFSKGGGSADNKAHHGGANDNECTRMLEIATASMKELMVLMKTKSLWTKPSDDVVGFVLVPERYENMFPRENHIESSKDSKVVPIGGLQLVEMLLDSEKWANLFPTIVSEAKTLKIFDVGSNLNRNGTLQLMHAKMHTFLPLMPERGFYFLRYCEQIDNVTWAIADVSFSSFGTLVDTPSRCPSGCIIRDMSDGTSMVTWIEHVEVDDRVHGNNVCSFIRKCASNEATKWLLALQRKCQKNICTSIDYVASHDKEIKTPEGRKNVMKLSNEMVQHFFRVLNTQSSVLQILEENNNDEPLIFIRQRTILSQRRNLMVLTCVAYAWISVSPHTLFYFLNDDNTRLQWDPLASANTPVHNIAHISIGANDACNRVSIIQTLNKRGNIILYLKESCIDILGAYVIYAPILQSQVNRALSGVDSSTMPMIIPSGFMISSHDGGTINVEASSNIENATSSRGRSLLTMAFQIVYVQVEPTIPRTEHVVNITRHTLSTIQNIKVAFES